jgi:hypothetical protein
LEVAPTLDLGLVPLLREALEVFLGVLPGGGALLGEFLAMKGSLGITATDCGGG